MMNVTEETADVAASALTENAADLEAAIPSAPERDAYRKRAADQVAVLQMVEHVLSGIEREVSGTPCEEFDTIGAKKALQLFLHTAEDPDSEDHAEADYLFQQEIESWSAALAERDAAISPAQLRRFCENSVPVLSSQALLALGRFYRNGAFAEPARAKFELIMTRLFARDVGDARRRLLFEKHEMVGHIAKLYDDWSSIGLFSAGSDQAAVARCMAKFESFELEADNTANLDKWFRDDLFGRLRSTKSDLRELFFVPEVVAAAVECNLKVGNRYVELVGKETGRFGAKFVEGKYGSTCDDAAADTLGKTMPLSELVRLESDSQPAPPVMSTDKVRIDVSSRRSAPRRSGKRGLPGVSKIWVSALAAAIVISFGVYLWSERFAGGESTSATVAAAVEFQNPEMSRHFSKMRMANETLYGIAEPAYLSLNPEQKRAFLNQALDVVLNEKQLRKINVMNAKGRTIAFATKKQIDLIEH
jgi:hypothetical protein